MIHVFIRSGWEVLDGRTHSMQSYVREGKQAKSSQVEEQNSKLALILYIPVRPSI